MASINKREDGWRVRWRDPDGQERSRQCPTKASALRLKAEVEADVAEGRRWEPRDLRKEPDLRDLLRDYAEECTRCLKPNTAIRYARSLDVFLRFLSAKFGTNAKLPPSLLTRRLLSDFHADLAHTGLHGNPRTEATKRKNIEVIQLCWQWLYDEDDSGATVPLPRKLRLRRQPTAMTVAPTWAEMDTCINALNSWHRTLAIVLRFTGLRVQQVMSLTWKDVDFERARLTIRGELGKSKQEQRGRIIPLSHHLLEWMRTFRRDDRSWIIVSNRVRGGNRERAPRARDFAAAWERAGIREDAWKQRPHHSFRKGFVSGLKRAGADPDAVEFLVGHSLGLRGVYIDPEALPLRETVDLIPPLVITTPDRMPLVRVQTPRAPLLSPAQHAKSPVTLEVKKRMEQERSPRAALAAAGAEVPGSVQVPAKPRAQKEGKPMGSKKEQGPKPCVQRVSTVLGPVQKTQQKKVVAGIVVEHIG